MHERNRLMLPTLALLTALLAGCGDGPAGPGSGEAASVRLNMHAVRLAIGQDTTVVATLHDHNGHEILGQHGMQLTWTSSHPTIATVVNGVVTGVGTGEAVVTAAAPSLPPASMTVQVLAPPVVYEALALGRLGSPRSNAWAINDGGVVAGWAEVSGGRAFRWSETDGMSALAGISSSRGINSAGAIVGSASHAEGFTAYVWLDGVRTDLPALEAGSNSAAHRINDDGTVAGISDPDAHAVVWRRGSDGSYGEPVRLGHRNINERPVINNRGDVAFTAFAPIPGAALNVPVLWRARADGSYEDALFLGRPEVGSYYVHDINDGGLIVGYRWTGGVEMAVLWHPADYSAPLDLGVGQAWGINNHGSIVGVTGGELPVFGGLPRRPALWQIDGAGVVHGPFDIGTPAGFEHGGARSINNDGWIAGSAWGPGGVMATLWRPEP